MYNEEKIDQYLTNRLGEKERADFNQEIATNSDLRDEVNVQRALLGGITAGGNRQLKTRLKAMHEAATQAEEKPEARVVQLRSRRWMAVAASVAILAIALWFFVAQPADNQALFANYYEPYQTNLTTRDMADTNPLAQIDALYKAGKYAEVIPIIEAELTKTPGNAKLSLAAGVSYLELGNLDKTQFHFKRAAANELLQEVAHWYLALTYLKQEDKAAAVSLLEKLKANASPHYQAKATDLLEKLK